MKNTTIYNLTPAGGQAVLNFQGRLLPTTIKTFETELIEEISQNKEQTKKEIDKQSLLNNYLRKNILIQGDCLSACAYLKTNNIKVDLVYIDPPFASGANYAKKIFLRNGKRDSVTNEDTTIGEEVMYGDIWNKEDYLNWLYERLVAIRDIMSDKGSIYVHLDWHIGPYVKVMLDEVFGESCFRNEIIWCYSGGGTPNDEFPRKHDNIYLYSRSDEEWVFNTEYRQYSEKTKQRGRTKVKGENAKLNPEGTPINDWWDDIEKITSPTSYEKLYYPTQKSEALLKRIIEISSDAGMIIADFFSGSGTTAKVANDLGRKFIACDIGLNAIQTTRDRLLNSGAEFNILKVKDGVRLFRKFSTNYRQDI